MDANVTLTGLLGGAPELRTSKNGTPWVSFRLGCTPRVKRQGEWVDDGTIWFSVHAWHSLARNAAASLGKGDRVIVTGRMRVEQWVGDDGRIRETKVIDATALGPDLTFTQARPRRLSAVEAAQPAGDEVPEEPGVEEPGQGEHQSEERAVGTG